MPMIPMLESVSFLVTDPEYSRMGKKQGAEGWSSTALPDSEFI